MSRDYLLSVKERGAMATKKNKYNFLYTKPHIAQMCVDRLLEYVDGSSDYFEPSAGNGVFLDALPYPTKRGIDTYPSRGDIKKDNFIRWPASYQKYDVVYGFPPIGKDCEKALNFIKVATKTAKCVAFILPRNFNKEHKQGAFPYNWILADKINLPDNSFTLFGEDVKVRFVFQIWINPDKMYYKGKDLRMSRIPLPVEGDFVFYPRWSTEGEWFMFGANPKRVIPIEEVAPNNRGWNFDATPEIVETLKTMDWSSYYEDTWGKDGNHDYFTKKQIYLAYLDAIGEHKY